LDIGTGDGRFVLEQARKHPDALCIGLDASKDGLIVASQKAAKKPARGGAKNALFILSAIEALPHDLCDIASDITINYPWGSLLDAVVRANAQFLQTLSRLARPGANIDMLINMSVFEGENYRLRLSLPEFDISRAKSELKYAYRDAGLKIERTEIVDEDKHAATTWGQKLVKGSGRPILAISCRKGA